MAKTDLTFITNEEGQTLLARFNVLIKDTQFFDVLVGYFFASGFYSLYKSLEKTEKIRILVGIRTNREVFRLIQEARSDGQIEFRPSSAEIKQELGQSVSLEMENSEDKPDVEVGARKFVEWLRSEKMEIKAYPTEDLHAKVYIMTFREEDRDTGRVITGSSNFSQSGLLENLEFNVELKLPSDHEFALKKFNDLWDVAVDVKDVYIESIQTKTWLNDSLTPYDLYLKFLYEYFKDQLGRAEDLAAPYLPANYIPLEYQEQAVQNIKRILDEYGGVFISDVVGLGKTYMSARLANDLDGRSLVIAPPVLLERKNLGSWPNVFEDFGVRQTRFESIGKLETLIKDGTEKYKNVFIDEAHRFRNETTFSYEDLAQICRGKRVILVTATPYNNSPRDILSQIKLFQKTRKSTIPGLPDIEDFIAKLQSRLDPLDRQTDYADYISITKENAKEIRDKLLRYLMVRRTRREIEKYFSKDLQKQGFKFPEVANPEPFFYQLNDKEDDVFSQTVRMLAQDFSYARYQPMLYYKGHVTQPERLAQTNMGKFMKILFIKRLESSFYAFRQTLARFLHSYEQFIAEFDNGNVYVSKKYTTKLFELLENDDEEAIRELIDEDKAKVFPSKDFDPKVRENLETDLAILRKIDAMWKTVSRDPKLDKFKKELQADSTLKSNKIIVFTESKETAEYLGKSVNALFPDKALVYTGASSEAVREKVIENFDARAKFPKRDYRILISTEVLSEGVNLHQSNVVINYDIPWNPTRLMQRIGRVNRVDTKFDKIHSFTFFPTKQSNDLIKLREAAESKIHAFMTLLGDDAAILTEGEPIGSHELFDRIMSKKFITGEGEEEETELKYLTVIKEIRDNDPDTFEKVKRLPKKARTGRAGRNPSLLTYFRKGKLQKFFMSSKEAYSEELDFLSAAKLLEATPKTQRTAVSADFFTLLDKNKTAFQQATTESEPEPRRRGGRDAASKIVGILRATSDMRQFTEDQEEYLKRVMIQIQEGGLPRQTLKTTLQALNTELKENGAKPLRILAILEKNIPRAFLQSHIAENTAQSAGPREVILSEYYLG